MINPKFFASSSLTITAWRLRYKLGEGSSKSTAVPESTRQDRGEQNHPGRCFGCQQGRWSLTSQTQLWNMKTFQCYFLVLKCKVFAEKGLVTGLVVNYICVWI